VPTADEIRAAATAMIADAEPDVACEVCGDRALYWRNCKLICRNCRSIVKSCADL
jgi:hypothetical protein